MRHALTRVGDQFGRRAYYRRDANCPAGLIYRYFEKADYLRASVWISNISEGGALFLVEGLFEPIEHIYVVLPGIKAKIPAKVVRQGDFIVAVEFATLLASALVDRIAAYEPKQARQGTTQPA